MPCSRLRLGSCIRQLRTFICKWLARRQIRSSGAGQLPGKSNYFIGNDPAKWHHNIPQFAQVRYRAVYPGVDLVYYGNQGQLEYDFEVAPGADPHQVALRFSGTDKISLDSGGNLVLAVAGGNIKFQSPHVYQTIGGEQKTVAGHFVLRGGNEVGFALGAYDRSRVLTIDPVLTYSTFLGGNNGETFPSIAVDSGSNAYIAGTTTSNDFPPQPGVIGAASGPSDVFIAKLTTNGTSLEYATYLGGSATDSSAGIAVDAGFNVTVAGTTNSSDFPTANAYQSTPNSASNHVFVTKLDNAGNIVYSTYLSGSGTDTATGVALDIRGKAYVTGTTTSTDFPVTTNAFQTTSRATNQFFMAKLDTATSGDNSRVYSTYFGGGNPSGGSTLGGGIAVDSNSNVYITGGTSFAYTGSNASTDFPIVNAFQSTLNGSSDAFAAKFDLTKTGSGQLVYSTYIGGSGAEIGNGIAVDSGGNAYITGSTTSTDVTLPATIPFQNANAGGTDAFLAKLGAFTPSTTSTTGTVTLNYFSYLGGSGTDIGLAVAADSTQGALITGSTNSGDLHNQNPIFSTLSGGTDAFVARFDTATSSATAPGHYATYLGGAGNDRGTGIVSDSKGATFVAGETASANFPVSGAFQGTLKGPSDAFVTKLGSSVNLAMTAAVSASPVGIGNQVTFTYTITNNGDLTTGITFTDVLPSNGVSFISATASPGSCGTPSGSPSTLTCSVPTLASSAVATITVKLTPTNSGSLGNSGTVTVTGSNFSTSANASVTINDFGLAVSPASATVAAGVPATFTATATPTGTIPNSISLSCSAGLPTGATCTFTNNPIPNLSSGPQSRQLVINTTARVTTTTELRKHPGSFYALFLPVSGLAFLGIGLGGTITRKRKFFAGLLLGGLFMFVLLQSSCGSSGTGTTTTTGTPAGTYNVTITATSGSATRTTTVQLVVQ